MRKKFSITLINLLANSRNKKIESMEMKSLCFRKSNLKDLHHVVAKFRFSTDNESSLS
jgi:hypothetical protein